MDIYSNKTLKERWRGVVERNSLNALHTKAGRENFWFHNRIPTIATLFAVIVLTASIVQCSLQVHPDLFVMYVGGIGWPDEYVDALTEELSLYVADINGDGKQVVNFYVLNIDLEAPDPNVLQKLWIEMSEGDTRMFLMDREIYEGYLDQDVFVDLSETLYTNTPTYGVETKNSIFSKENNLEAAFADIVACVKFIRPGQEEKLGPMQDNAMRVIEYFNK